MADKILEIRDLMKTFESGKKKSIKAVNKVSFNVNKGETIGIVGESGCGKSTLGRCIVNAHSSTGGEIIYKSLGGEEYDLANLERKDLQSLRKEIQMIFQDPYSSLNPRMTVFEILAEPLRANFKLPKEELEKRVKEIAQKVGLNPSYLMRYPHAFSGGQRQRIGIARALILLPQLIVCDESVSALDVSVQAQVINLLKELQDEFGLTYLFISHDLSVVEYISDKVVVMYCGRIVEYAMTKELFTKPMHPYTEALLSAVPVADPEHQIERIPLEGEVPNPSEPPSGCLFHPRCRYAVDRCKKEIPQCDGESRKVACFRSKELELRGISYE